MASSRRAFLRAAGAAGLLGGLARGAATNPSSRPNVVLIISDDHGWCDYGFMGHDRIKTPNLDAMARRGATFGNGYVAAPLCCPSLTTLLTGLHPHQHKVSFNDPPRGGAASRPTWLKDKVTIPRLLKAAGYRSLQTGKFWDGHFANAGFTEGMTVKGRHGDEGLAIGRQTMAPITTFLDDCKAKSEPFFLWYAPMMPHLPHTPPADILAKYADVGDAATAKYYAMVEWFDQTIGQLVKALEDRGLRQNTLILYLADNGWVQGHMSQKSGSPAARAGAGAGNKGKNTPFDGGVRTPIILDWPGQVKGGRYDELVSSVDLAPTILAACGAQAPEGLPGVDLLPVACGREPLKRTAVCGAAYVHTAKDVDRPGENLLYRWVREGDWKLIVAKADDSVQLYNLKDDPFENNDLAPQQADKVRHLRQVVDAWWDGR